MITKRNNFKCSLIVKDVGDKEWKGRSIYVRYLRRGFQRKKCGFIFFFEDQKYMFLNIYFEGPKQDLDVFQTGIFRNIFSRIKCGRYFFQGSKVGFFFVNIILRT